jgi:hypothetical protein
MSDSWTGLVIKILVLGGALGYVFAYIHAGFKRLFQKAADAVNSVVNLSNPSNPSNSSKSSDDAEREDE